MIVKLQISLATTHPKRRMLITCKGGRAFEPYEADATAEILAVMDGQKKAFFHAEIDAAGRIVIGAPALEQDW